MSKCLKIVIGLIIKLKICFNCQDGLAVSVRGGPHRAVEVRRWFGGGGAQRTGNYLSFILS